MYQLEARGGAFRILPLLLVLAVNRHNGSRRSSAGPRKELQVLLAKEKHTRESGHGRTLRW